MLTKEFLKALKQADTICFRLNDGKHTLEASKRVNDGVYGDHTVRADLSIDGFVRDYGKNGGQIDTAFCYLGSAKYIPEIQTILTLLRAGDHIKVMWIANNDSEVLTNAGFCQDEVRLIVTRQAASGRSKVLNFLIDSQVSPINSSARICRRGPSTLAVAS